MKKKTTKEDNQKNYKAAQAEAEYTVEGLLNEYREEVAERRAEFQAKMDMEEATLEDKLNEVLARIGDEGLSVIRACRGVMNRTYFHDKVNEDEGLSDNYARACEWREEFLFDKIELIAEKRDEETLTAGVGANVIQRDKLIIDTLKWKLARMNKKYGDKFDIDLGSEQPITITFDLGEDKSEE